MKLCILNFFILVILSFALVECQKRTNAEDNRTSNRPLRSSYGAYNATSASTTKSKTAKKSGGVGAWGYIAIILTIILSALGVYYTIIFYPILKLCRKERMYDVMGGTTV